MPRNKPYRISQNVKHNKKETFIRALTVKREDCNKPKGGKCK